MSSGNATRSQCSSRPRRPVLTLGLDPNTLARRLLRTLHTPTAPLVACLLREHHISSEILSSNPEDVISSLTATIEDPCVRYDVSQHLQEVSTRIHPVSPISSRHVPRAHEIAQWIQGAMEDPEPAPSQEPSPHRAESISPWNFRSAASTPCPEPASPSVALGSPMLPTSTLGDPGISHSPPSTPSEAGGSMATATEYFPSVSSTSSDEASPTSPIFSHVENFNSEELSLITPFHDHYEASGKGPHPGASTPYDDHPPASIEQPAVEGGPSSTPTTVVTSYVLGLTTEDITILMGLPDAMFVTLFRVVLRRTTGNDVTTTVGNSQNAASPTSAESAMLQRLVQLAEEGLAARYRDAGTQTDELGAEVGYVSLASSSTDLAADEDGGRFPGFISLFT